MEHSTTTTTTTTTTNYRFPLSASTEWLKHLREHGYVVVKEVVNKDEVDKAKSLIWDWLEGLKSGIDRSDVGSWINESWPGSLFMGFLTTFGGGQCSAAWFLRGLPNVKKTFSLIFDTEDLITSMDTFIAWRPWWRSKMSGKDENWEPIVERLHCDQNPYTKKGFHCVQGMIPLVPVTEESGGLQIVPDTNTDSVQEYLRDNYPSTAYYSSDWCELRPNDKYIGKGQLLLVSPGDIILWDSRTIHGGLVGNGKREESSTAPAELTRLSLTVCMVPKSRASSEVLENRLLAYKNGWTLTHWADQFIRHSIGNSNGRKILNYQFIPPTLTPQQLELLG